MLHRLLLQQLLLLLIGLNCLLKLQLMLGKLMLLLGLQILFELYLSHLVQWNGNGVQGGL